MAIALTLNGQPARSASDASTPLLYVLRNELDQHGPRFGCGLAQCGACTVHVDGRAARARGLAAQVGLVRHERRRRCRRRRDPDRTRGRPPGA